MTLGDYASLRIAVETTDIDDAKIDEAVEEVRRRHAKLVEVDRPAQVGDVVTFFLKFSNHGGQPINNVAVSDSLTGRLEYIPGTARADRDTVFTTQTNEAGSAVLRWEVSGVLLPGESGVVSFQARVR